MRILGAVLLGSLAVALTHGSLVLRHPFVDTASEDFRVGYPLPPTFEVTKGRASATVRLLYGAKVMLYLGKSLAILRRDDDLYTCGDLPIVTHDIPAPLPLCTFKLKSGDHLLVWLESDNIVRALTSDDLVWIDNIDESLAPDFVAEFVGEKAACSAPELRFEVLARKAPTLPGLAATEHEPTALVASNGSMASLAHVVLQGEALHYYTLDGMACIRRAAIGEISCSRPGATHDGSFVGVGAEDQVLLLAGIKDPATVAAEAAKFLNGTLSSPQEAAPLDSMATYYAWAALKRTDGADAAPY